MQLIASMFVIIRGLGPVVAANIISLRLAKMDALALQCFLGTMVARQHLIALILIIILKDVDPLLVELQL